MEMIRNRHRMGLKIIAMVVVCLFSINTVAWTAPVNTPEIRKDTLAVQSGVNPFISGLKNEGIFEPLKKEGIPVTFQMKTEILLGLQELLKRKPYSTVNAMLIGKHGDGIQKGKREITFLSKVERINENNIKAQFVVEGRDDVVFEVEYDGRNKTRAKVRTKDETSEKIRENKDIPQSVIDVWSKAIVLLPNPVDAWVGMGRDLYNKYECVKEVYDRAAIVLNCSNLEGLFLREKDKRDLEPAAIATILYTVSIYKLFSEKLDMEIMPRFLMGNSRGTVSAAIISGAISLEDALRLTKYQMACFKKTVKEHDYGIMKICGLDAEKITAILIPGKIEIFQESAPFFTTLVVSRDVDHNKLLKQLEKMGAEHVKYFKEPLMKGPHCSYYKKDEKSIRNFVQQLEIKKPKIPIISSSNGEKILTAEGLKELLVNYFSAPILWRIALERAVEDGGNLFVSFGASRKMLLITEKLQPEIQGIGINNVEEIEAATHHLEHIVDESKMSVTKVNLKRDIELIKSAQDKLEREYGIGVYRSNNLEGKTGQVIEVKINTSEKAVIIGDLHGDLESFEKIVSTIDMNELKNNKTKVFILGDFLSVFNFDDYENIIGGDADGYEEYLATMGKRIYNCFLRITELINAYPDSFFVLPRNGELDFSRHDSGKPFMSLFEKNGTMLKDQKELYKTICNFINSLPLFAVVKSDGQEFLLSHGGVALTENIKDRKDLVNFKREGVLPLSSSKESEDIKNFKKTSFTNLIFTEEKFPKENIKNACTVLGVDAQISGHLHLFGGKQMRTPGRHGIVMTDETAETAYGVAYERIHTVNSLEYKGRITYLEMEKATNGEIEIRAKNIDKTLQFSKDSKKREWYSQVINNVERISKVEAIISDFDGVDRKHDEETVSEKIVGAKRQLSGKGVLNVTITGSPKDLFVRRYGGGRKIGTQSAGTSYHLLFEAGSGGIRFDSNGRVNMIPGYQEIKYNSDATVKLIKEIAKTKLYEFSDKIGFDRELLKKIRFVVSRNGVTIEIDEEECDDLRKQRFEIARLVREEIQSLKEQGKIDVPESTEIVCSYDAVDIKPTNKGMSAIQMIKLHKLKSVVLMADSVGTESDPGNDRSLLALNKEKLREAGIDWDVDLIKIYVGNEENVEIPEGVIILSQTDKDSAPALKVYEDILIAKGEDGTGEESEKDKYNKKNRSDIAKELIKLANIYESFFPNDNVTKEKTIHFEQGSVRFKNIGIGENKINSDIKIGPGEKVFFGTRSLHYCIGGIVTWIKGSNRYLWVMHSTSLKYAEIERDGMLERKMHSLIKDESIEIESIKVYLNASNFAKGWIGDNGHKYIGGPYLEADGIAQDLRLKKNETLFENNIFIDIKKTFPKKYKKKSDEDVPTSTIIGTFEGVIINYPRGKNMHQVIFWDDFERWIEPGLSRYDDIDGEINIIGDDVETLEVVQVSEKQSEKDKIGLLEMKLNPKEKRILAYLPKTYIYRILKERYNVTPKLVIAIRRLAYGNFEGISNEKIELLFPNGMMSAAHEFDSDYLEEITKLIIKESHDYFYGMGAGAVEFNPKANDDINYYLEKISESLELQEIANIMLSYGSPKKAKEAVERGVVAPEAYLGRDESHYIVSLLDKDREKGELLRYLFKFDFPDSELTEKELKSNFVDDAEMGRLFGYSREDILAYAQYNHLPDYWDKIKFYKAAEMFQEIKEQEKERNRASGKIDVFPVEEILREQINDVSVTEGLEEFQKFIDRLPKKITNKLVSSADNVSQQLLLLFAGIVGETTCLSSPEAIRISLNKEEREQLVKAVEADDNFFVIKNLNSFEYKGKIVNRERWRTVNIKAALRIMKNNIGALIIDSETVLDAFPKEALKNPKKWLKENQDEWDPKYGPLERIRYGLLSGYPIRSVIENGSELQEVVIEGSEFSGIKIPSRFNSAGFMPYYEQEDRIWIESREKIFYEASKKLAQAGELKPNVVEYIKSCTGFDPTAVSRKFIPSQQAMKGEDGITIRKVVPGLSLETEVLDSSEIDLETSEKWIEFQIRFLNRFKRQVKDYPVNMYIDLSNIPEEKGQLEQNIKTIARLIAWHNKFNLNIRYMLENDEMGKGLKILQKELYDLGDFPGIDSGKLLDLIGMKNSHIGEDAIEVYLQNEETIKEVGDREYIVALKDNKNVSGIQIPNYSDAATMGLSFAVLRILWDKVPAKIVNDKKKPDESSDEWRIYTELRNMIFGKFNNIFFRYKINIIGGESKFSLIQLQMMVTGNAETRRYLAGVYALPPMIKGAVEFIDQCHGNFQLMLQAA